VLERWVWAAALLALILSGWRFGRRQARGIGEAPASLIIPVPPLVRPESIAAASRMVTMRNPFRFARRPAEVRFGEAATEPVAGPPRQVPQLALLGTVGGPPWQAVVRGLPGRPGPHVVRAGDSAGTLLVEFVGRDSVRFRGPDTTWVVVARRPRS
jgi:hypothetical protein